MNQIAVSTYSFWQFRHQNLRDIEKCIDLAAEWGFDGVELLLGKGRKDDSGQIWKKALEGIAALRQASSGRIPFSKVNSK